MQSRATCIELKLEAKLGKDLESFLSSEHVQLHVQMG